MSVIMIAKHLRANTRKVTYKGIPGEQFRRPITSEAAVVAITVEYHPFTSNRGCECNPLLARLPGRYGHRCACYP